MTLGDTKQLWRSSLLALTVAAGIAAGTTGAAADGLPSVGKSWHAWSGLYGGISLGSLDAGWDDGFAAGVQIGKNWQSGKIVYGLEGDLSFTGTDFIDWIGTVRGRLGYLLAPSILVYGTAGFGHVNFEGGSETDLVLGVGVETKLTQATTVRLEYLNFDDTNIDVVRLGVNWKLNW
jgi:outer membrane immunogenic protein